MTWAVPPAASIFSRALLVNASARTNSVVVTLAHARILSGRRSRRTSPACFRVSALTVTGGAPSDSSLPASIAALIAPTLTTSYWTSLMFRKPRSLGIRMWSGVWPPSNQAGIEAPARERWPFVPRPAVLPLPAAMPRPTRVFG